MAYMLVISQILCVIMVNMWSGGSWWHIFIWSDQKWKNKFQVSKSNTNTNTNHTKATQIKCQCQMTRHRRHSAEQDPWSPCRITWIWSLSCHDKQLWNIRDQKSGAPSKQNVRKKVDNLTAKMLLSKGQMSEQWKSRLSKCCQSLFHNFREAVLHQSVL